MMGTKLLNFVKLTLIFAKNLIIFGYITTKNCSLDKSYITLSSWRGNRGKEGEFYVAPFLQLNKESCFWRKCPGFIHLWVKFLIENAVLRTSQKKYPKLFPAKAFLLHVAD